MQSDDSFYPILNHLSGKSAQLTAIKGYCRTVPYLFLFALLVESIKIVAFLKLLIVHFKELISATPPNSLFANEYRQWMQKVK